MKISFIIPTLNEEKVLEKTLQTLKQLDAYTSEIIISDGRSKDATIAIAKKYTDKIIVYEGTRRQTIAQARNLGATQAVGEFYVFLDADVEIPNINSFFKHAFRHFDEIKDLSGLMVRLRVMKEYATWADKLFFGLLNWTYIIANNVFNIGAAPGEFQMMKGETFKKLGGYNEQLVASEDNELFSRLAKEGDTKADTTLYVLHTSRRAHKVGWPRLLTLWLLNPLFNKLFKQSYSSVWEEVR